MAKKEYVITYLNYDELKEKRIEKIVREFNGKIVAGGFDFNTRVRDLDLDLDEENLSGLIIALREFGVDIKELPEDNYQGH